MKNLLLPLLLIFSFALSSQGIKFVKLESGQVAITNSSDVKIALFSGVENLIIDQSSQDVIIITKDNNGRDGVGDYRISQPSVIFPASTDVNDLFEQLTATYFHHTLSIYEIINGPNFEMRVGLGLIPGAANLNVNGANLDLDVGTESTLWDVSGGFRRKKLHEEGAETMFISSTSTLDVTQSITVLGLDENYLEVFGTAVLNGQNQVEVVNLFGGGPLTFIIVHNILKANDTDADLLGDVYIAESAALTAGVPTDLTLAQGRIQQGLLGSDNISHNGFFIVPAGKTYLSRRDLFGVGKNKDVAFNIYIKPFGGSELMVATARVYQSNINAFLGSWVSLPEKSYFEFTGQTSNNNTEGFGTIDITSFDNAIFGF